MRVVGCKGFGGGRTREENLCQLIVRASGLSEAILEESDLLLEFGHNRSVRVVCCYTHLFVV
jgi:hypothetical protein